MNLDQLNIFNEPLEECSNEPKTGFFRTGCCETDAQDIGTHTCLLYTSPSPRDRG